MTSNLTYIGSLLLGGGGGGGTKKIMKVSNSSKVSANYDLHL